MAGGRAVKQRGTSYEVRVAKYFSNWPGWQGKRIPLSGASQQITEAIGAHDVRAWNEKLGIFLQVEAKKRGSVSNKLREDQLEIKDEWIQKIDFTKDEILVFATNRSPHYCMIPTKRFFQILNRSFEITYEQENTFKGDKQFLFKRHYIDDSPDKRFHVKWGTKEALFTICLLDEFITLRETANLHDDLSPEDKIKRLTSLEMAVEFEKLNCDDLTYKQKKFLYMKLEEFESGILVNPIMHAESQFWTDEAFVIVCPHCEEKVTTKDLTEKKLKSPTD